MTPRQVVGLLAVIQKSDLIAFYTSSLSYRYSQAKELPSLNEFLALSLKEKTDEVAFDDKTDELLEKHALKLLEQGRKKNV